MDDPPALNLPVELWIKIALILRDEGPCEIGPYCYENDIKAVKPLCESCRWLHAVLQPILYESITVDAGDIHTRKVASLASTLSTRPDLQSSVRTLGLGNVRSGGPWDTLLATLPLLVEIRFLSLASGVIDEAIVKLLHDALQLRTLHISNTRWGVDIPENWSQDGSFGENLTELHVDDTDMDPPHDIPRTLQLFARTVAKLEIDSDLIAKLTKLPAFLSFGPSLLQLVTKASDPIYHPPLHQLLSRSPNLEDLDAQGLCLVSSIDDEYLPNLRSIKADTSFVTALLPGRPIQSITTLADPKLFANPLPWLEVLYLDDLSEQRGGLEVIDALWVACPRLTRLELQPMKSRDFGPLAKRIETRLTSDAAALPRLQVLHLKYMFSEFYWVEPIQAPLSEKMQSEGERITQAKRQYCPDLCDVWLSPEHAWMYIPDDDAWIPQGRGFI